MKSEPFIKIDPSQFPKEGQTFIEIRCPVTVTPEVAAALESIGWLSPEDAMKLRDALSATAARLAQLTK